MYNVRAHSRRPLNPPLRFPVGVPFSISCLCSPVIKLRRCTVSESCMVFALNTRGHPDTSRGALRDSPAGSSVACKPPRLNNLSPSLCRASLSLSRMTTSRMEGTRWPTEADFFRSARHETPPPSQCFSPHLLIEAMCHDPMVKPDPSSPFSCILLEQLFTRPRY